VDLSGTPVHIMLYADDIVFVSESPGGLQRHLVVLDDFCIERGLTVNLGKTKVMIFHTSRQGRAHAAFTLGGGQVEIVTTYVYLGVTFSTAAVHHGTSNERHTHTRICSTSHARAPMPPGTLPGAAHEGVAF